MTAGTIEMSTAYLSRYQGPISEADDPYDQSPTSDYCTDCDPVRYVDNVVFLPTRSGTTDNAYIKAGPCPTMAVSTPPSYYQDSSYNSSSKTYYYDDPNNSFDDSNHAVVIVGWDDDKYVPKAPAGIDTGPSSSETAGGPPGAKAATSTSPITTKVSRFRSLAYFDETTESAFSFDTVYYYDELGRTGAMGYDDTVAWGANWFVPAQDESLTAVGFYAMDSPNRTMRSTSTRSSTAFPSPTCRPPRPGASPTRAGTPSSSTRRSISWKGTVSGSS